MFRSSRSEGLEVAPDQAAVGPTDAGGVKGLVEREPADVLVGAIGLAVVRDVPLFPVLPEGRRVDAARPRVVEDRPEDAAGAGGRIDERAEDIEGEQLRTQ